VCCRLVCVSVWLYARPGDVSDVLGLCRRKESSPRSAPLRHIPDDVSEEELPPKDGQIVV
jgi:hypothetical protein